MVKLYRRIKLLENNVHRLENNLKINTSTAIRRHRQSAKNNLKFK